MRHAPVHLLAILLLVSCNAATPPPVSVPALAAHAPLRLPWAADLPVYDHVVIVVEENKDFAQITTSPRSPS